VRVRGLLPEASLEQRAQRRPEAAFRLQAALPSRRS
jgi:hypothetical protein